MTEEKVETPTRTRSKAKQQTASKEGLNAGALGIGAALLGLIGLYAATTPATRETLGTGLTINQDSLYIDVDGEDQQFKYSIHENVLNLFDVAEQEWISIADKEDLNEFLGNIFRWRYNMEDSPWDHVDWEKVSNMADDIVSKLWLPKLELGYLEEDIIKAKEGMGIKSNKIVIQLHGRDLTLEREYVYSTEVPAEESAEDAMDILQDMYEELFPGCSNWYGDALDYKDAMFNKQLRPTLEAAINSMIAKQEKATNEAYVQKVIDAATSFIKVVSEQKKQTALPPFKNDIRPFMITTLDPTTGTKIASYISTDMDSIRIVDWHAFRVKEHELVDAKAFAAIAIKQVHPNQQNLASVEALRQNIIANLLKYNLNNQPNRPTS